MGGRWCGGYQQCADMGVCCHAAPASKLEPDFQIAALVGVLVISVIHLAYPQVADWWGVQLQDILYTSCFR